jgi:hypothetical protein
MSMLAVSTGIQVLAIIGLVVGLVVFGVVIFLLSNTLKPLLKVSSDVQLALTAPMLERGVPGTEQLGQTRRLAESVPPLAIAYLQKLSLSPAAPAAPAPYQPAASAAPSGPNVAGPSGVASWRPPPPPPPKDQADLPAWQRYRG